MTSAAEFIDGTLRAEGSDARADADADRIGGGLRFYGASVGAVRGTVRDAHRRYPRMPHDEVTALASELWSEPVYERRLAAIVLLQRALPLLRGKFDEVSLGRHRGSSKGCQPVHKPGGRSSNRR